MRSGIKWEENNIALGTITNNETKMEKSINPVEYVLSQPMNTVPEKV
jgi:hypothetical protein